MTSTPGQPECSAGADYPQAECPQALEGTVSIQLDGSLSTDPEGGELSFFWTSNCPGASFDDASSANPVLSFSGTSAEGVPVSCSAYLSVANSGQEDSCSAVVSVGGCPVDCLGVFRGSAQFDRCGVCNGDGTSCLGCEDVNISGQQFLIDGTSLDQAKLVQRVSRLILKNKRAKARSRNLANNSITRAQALYQDSWGKTWSLPQIATSCSNTQFCVQSDNSATISSVLDNSAQLQALTAKVVAELRKVRKDRRLGGSYLKKAAKLHNINVTESAKIPASTSSCTQPVA